MRSPGPHPAGLSPGRCQGRVRGLMGGGRRPARASRPSATSPRAAWRVGPDMDRGDADPQRSIVCCLKYWGLRVASIQDSGAHDAIAGEQLHLSQTIRVFTGSEPPACFRGNAGASCAEDSSGTISHDPGAARACSWSGRAAASGGRRTVIGAEPPNQSSLPIPCF